MRFPIGAMSVGDILDRGLKVLLSRLGAFYVIFLVVLSPVILLQLLGPKLVEIAVASGLGLGAALVPALLVLAVTLILSPIGTAAVIHVISQEFIGERVSVGEAFSFGMSRFGIVLGTSIVTGLLIALGLVACIVPGVIFFLWWAFAAGGQIPVVEGKSAGAAMRRSKQLGSGFLGRIFGIFVLIVVLTAIVQYGVGTALNAALPAAEVVPGQFGTQSFVFNYRNYAIQTLVTQLVGILVQTYTSICMTLLYFDLRIRKEGFDLELAARQQLRPEARPES